MPPPQNSELPCICILQNTLRLKILFTNSFRKNASAKPLRAAAAPLAFKVYYKPKKRLSQGLEHSVP